MTIWWCRGCGFEDTRQHDACSSCGSALQVAEVEWLNDGDEGEETVFELETEPIERATIVEALVTNGIRHRWESVTDLVIPDTRVDEVDEILDEIMGEDTRADDDGDEGSEFDDVDDDDEDDATEGSDNGYDVMSQLFVATTALLKGRDEDDVMDFVDAATVTLMTGVPFGVDDETWADIQSAARNISAALDGDIEAPVDADIKGLHNQLQLLV